MQDIQEVFNRMQENKKKQKDIRRAYKEALQSNQELQEIMDKLKTLRERKKQIENTIKESFSGEFTKLDDLKIDLESDAVMLNDISLTKLMKGETVQVVDQYNNTYDPLFTVKFKKS
jgi:predicted phage-related endonuclease